LLVDAWAGTIFELKRMKIAETALLHMY